MESTETLLQRKMPTLVEFPFPTRAYFPPNNHHDVQHFFQLHLQVYRRSSLL